jgi:hypothetical protein
MNEMPTSPDLSQDLPPEAPKKNNTTIIIVAVVAVVLLCCCCLTVAGGVWLWNNGDALLGTAQQLISM